VPIRFHQQVASPTGLQRCQGLSHQAQSLLHLADMPRATWQHSRDTSTVWAMALLSSSDPDFVESEAIPWLLLQVMGDQPEPTGGDSLTRTMFIQRVNTSGARESGRGLWGVR
jgi:Protein of unknown function (DUF3455)